MPTDRMYAERDMGRKDFRRRGTVRVHLAAEVFRLSIFGCNIRGGQTKSGALN